MAEQPTTREMRAIEDVSEAVAVQLAQGTPPEEIVSQLAGAGWDRASAQTLVDTVRRTLDACRASPDGRGVGSTRGGWRILIGLVLIAAGGVAVLSAGAGGAVGLGAGIAVVVGTVLGLWGGYAWFRSGP